MRFLPILLLTWVLFVSCSKENKPEEGEVGEALTISQSCDQDPNLVGVWMNANRNETIGFGPKCNYYSDYCTSSALYTDDGITPNGDHHFKFLVSYSNNEVDCPGPGLNNCVYHYWNTEKTQIVLRCNGINEQHYYR